MKTITPFLNRAETVFVDPKLGDTKGSLHEKMTGRHLTPSVYYPQIVTLFNKLDKSDDWHHDEDVCQLVKLVLDDVTFRNKLSDTTVFKAKSDETNGRPAESSDKHRFLSTQLDKPDHPTGPELDEFLQIIKNEVASRADEWADGMSEYLRAQPVGAGQTKKASPPPADILLPVLKGITERTLLRVFENILGAEIKGGLGAINDMRKLPEICCRPDTSFVDKLIRIQGVIDDSTHRLSGLRKDQQEWVNSLKAALKHVQKFASNFEKESSSSVSLSLGLLADTLASAQSLLQAAPSLAGTSDTHIRSLTSIHQLVTQAQKYYALPPNASFTDFLSQFEGMKPLTEAFNAIYEKIQTVLAVLPENPSIERKFESICQAFENTAPKKVAELNKLLGQDAADTIRRSLLLVKQAGAYPSDKNLMVQLDWFQKQVPSLQQLFSGESGSTRQHAHSLAQLDTLLNMINPATGTWDKAKGLVSLINPSTLLSVLAGTALPALAGIFPAGPLALLTAQKTQEFYSGDGFSASWSKSLRNFAEYISKDIAKNPKDYSRIMPSGEVYAPAVNAALVWWNSSPAQSWSDSVGQLVKSASSTHPVAQRIYQGYMELSLGWKLYQASKENDPREVVKHLEEIRDVAKSYIMDSRLGGVAPLVDLLPLLPALSAARKEIAQIGPTDSWGGWAEQLVAKLADSENPTLQQLKSRLTDQLESWAAEKLSTAINAVQILPGADAAALPVKKGANSDIPVSDVTEADFQSMGETEATRRPTSLTSFKYNEEKPASQVVDPEEILVAVIDNDGFTLSKDEVALAAGGLTLAMGAAVAGVAVCYGVYKYTSASKDNSPGTADESIPLAELPAAREGVAMSSGEDVPISFAQSGSFKSVRTTASASDPLSGEVIREKVTFLNGKHVDKVYSNTTESAVEPAEKSHGRKLIAGVCVGLGMTALAGTAAYNYFNREAGKVDDEDKNDVLQCGAGQLQTHNEHGAYFKPGEHISENQLQLAHDYNRITRQLETDLENLSEIATPSQTPEQCKESLEYLAFFIERIGVAIELELDTSRWNTELLNQKQSDAKEIETTLDTSHTSRKGRHLLEDEPLPLLLKRIRDEKKRVIERQEEQKIISDRNEVSKKVNDLINVPTPSNTIEECDSSIIHLHTLIAELRRAFAMKVEFPQPTLRLMMENINKLYQVMESREILIRESWTEAEVIDAGNICLAKFKDGVEARFGDKMDETAYALKYADILRDRHLSIKEAFPRQGSTINVVFEAYSGNPRTQPLTLHELLLGKQYARTSQGDVMWTVDENYPGTNRVYVSEDAQQDIYPTRDILPNKGLWKVFENELPALRLDSNHKDKIKDYFYFGVERMKNKLLSERGVPDAIKDIIRNGIEPMAVKFNGLGLKDIGAWHVNDKVVMFNMFGEWKSFNDSAAGIEQKVQDFIIGGLTKELQTSAKANKSRFFAEASTKIVARSLPTSRSPLEFMESANRFNDWHSTLFDHMKKNLDDMSRSPGEVLCDGIIDMAKSYVTYASIVMPGGIIKSIIIDIMASVLKLALEHGKSDYEEYKKEAYKEFLSDILCSAGIGGLALGVKWANKLAKTKARDALSIPWEKERIRVSVDDIIGTQSNKIIYTNTAADRALYRDRAQVFESIATPLGGEVRLTASRTTGEIVRNQVIDIFYKNPNANVTILSGTHGNPNGVRSRDLNAEIEFTIEDLSLVPRAIQEKVTVLDLAHSTDEHLRTIINRAKHGDVFVGAFCFSRNDNFIRSVLDLAPKTSHVPEGNFLSGIPAMPGYSRPAFRPNNFLTERAPGAPLVTPDTLPSQVTDEHLTLAGNVSPETGQRYIFQIGDTGGEKWQLFDEYARSSMRNHDIPLNHVFGEMRGLRPDSFVQKPKINTLSGLTLNDRLDIPVHGSITGPADSGVRNLASYQSFSPAQLVQKLQSYGLKEVGILRIDSCHVGAGFYLPEVKRMLDRAGIKVGYLSAPNGYLQVSHLPFLKIRPVYQTKFWDPWNVVEGNVKLDFPGTKYRNFDYKDLSSPSERNAYLTTKTLESDVGQGAVAAVGSDLTWKIIRTALYNYPPSLENETLTLTRIERALANAVQERNQQHIVDM